GHAARQGFMDWRGRTLAAAGGLRVAGLCAMRRSKGGGGTFEWPVDGAKVFMGPEESMQGQRDLGSDVVMIFDECTPYPADEDVARVSMERSLRWAKRSKNAHGENTAALTGILQGGMHDNLRTREVDGMAETGIHGHALGWLSGAAPKHAFD
ncbi:tRNA-guanine transglycosylase, partial [Pseudomonas syringae]